MKPHAPRHEDPHRPIPMQPLRPHPRFQSTLARFSRTSVALLVVPIAVHADPPPYEVGVPSWLAARSWLDKSQWPDPATAAAQIDRSGFAGVSAVLRLDGRTVGRASAFTDDAAILRRTAGKAFAQAMSDPAITALPATLEAEAPAKLTLELEFASVPEPLLGRTFGAAIKRLRPGIDGIALRRGAAWAYAFPGRMLATATAGSAASTMLRLAADLGLPPKDLDHLRTIDDVGLYRFETLRLAQSKPTALPFEATRSGAVSNEAIDAAATARLASSIIAHLRQHRVGNGEPDEDRPSFLGDFNPISGRHDPIEAPPRDRALVAWALAVAANARGLPGAERTNAKTLAVELLRTLDAPPARDATTALAVLAASILSTMDGPVDVVIQTTLRDGGGVLLEDVPCEDPSFCALLAAAVASLPTSVERIQARIHDAWRDATPEGLIANLDWLALAERSLARRSGETSQRLGLLRDIATMLVARQHREHATADLIGAIPFNAQRRDVVDARTLRLGFAIRVLADLDPSIPADTHGGMIRFARQLQMAETEARLHRGHRKAIGGICESPWSPKQPLASSAMGLVLAAENLR